MIFTAKKRKMVDDASPTFLRESLIYVNGSHLCVLQNSVGHCCGVTFMANIECRNGIFKDVEKVNSFFEWLIYPPEEDEESGEIDCPDFGHLFDFRKLCFYLSKETAWYDEGLRNHPDVKKIHSFKNNANIVTLYEVDLECLTSC